MKMIYICIYEQEPDSENPFQSTSDLEFVLYNNNSNRDATIEVYIYVCVCIPYKHTYNSSVCTFYLQPSKTVTMTTTRKKVNRKFSLVLFQYTHTTTCVHMKYLVYWFVIYFFFLLSFCLFFHYTHLNDKEQMCTIRCCCHHFRHMVCHNSLALWKSLSCHTSSPFLIANNDFRSLVLIFYFLFYI